MNRPTLFALALSAGFLIAATSQASVQWEVTSARNNATAEAQSPGGTPAPHGLWTNNYIGGTTGYLNYFNFQNGTTFTQYGPGDGLLNGTAKLFGTATNLGGVTAELDLMFSGFVSDLSGGGTFKDGSGYGYQPSVQDFYTTIDAGSKITFTNGIGAVVIIDLAGTTTFQMGIGANDKTNDFGASAWLIPQIVVGGTTLDHWDINLNLSPGLEEEGGETPEPLSLMVWSVLALSAIAHRSHSRDA